MVLKTVGPIPPVPRAGVVMNVRFDPSMIEAIDGIAKRIEGELTEVYNVTRSDVVRLAVDYLVATIRCAEEEVR